MQAAGAGGGVRWWLVGTDSQCWKHVLYARAVTYPRPPQPQLAPNSLGKEAYEFTRVPHLSGLCPVFRTSRVAFGVICVVGSVSAWGGVGVVGGGDAEEVQGLGLDVGQGDHLTATGTCYPGTNLTLTYRVRSGT